MKKNGIRLTKLEDRIIGNSLDVFRFSDLEILERIEALEFQKGMKPTQKFKNMKKVADRTKPIFSPKVFQRMRDEQAERNAEIEAMNDVELDDHLDKLIIECEMEGAFKNYHKPKKETLC